MCEHINHDEAGEELLPFATCDKCDCEIEEGEEKEHPTDYRLYCEDCFDELFFTCEDCSSTFSRRFEIPRDGNLYCRDCYYERYTTCDWCGETEDRDDCHLVQGDSVCESCYENGTGHCSGCGESFPSDDVHYHERSGNYYCDGCQPSSIIQSYHYEPDLYFKAAEKEQGKEKRSLLYFGVEIETASTRGDCEDTASACLDCWKDNHFFAKSDSSINKDNYEGFELVSHPSTYAWWKEHKEEVSRMLSVLRRDKFESYTTGLCGMHIHVSKRAISPVDQYKLQKLVYENPDMVLKLSCRRKKDLISWANCYLDQGDTHGMPDRAKWAKLSKGEYAGHIARYVALNFTGHTIEFRIFRGTLAEKGFWRNMEIVQSMLAYVSQAGIMEVSGEGYLLYVSSARKDYLNLYTHIRGKMSAFGIQEDEEETEE